MAEVKLVDAPDWFWRIGRAPNPLTFSEISPEEAAVPTGGNRFDLPGGGVLYAASAPDGAYAETLARFRPTAAMRALPPEEDEHLMAVGAIPADWRTRRLLAKFELEEPLPFVDVDDPETHTALTATLAPVLEGMGVQNLDVATVRGSMRLVTRAIATYAYVAADDEGQPLYSGLRYGSRLGPWECWAIFDGVRIGRAESFAIGKSEDALRRIARQFDLTIH